MLLLRERLEHYLSSKGIESLIEQVTPDASTRRYFRFQDGERSCIACVYPDDIKHAAHNYIDVSTLFLNNGLPVAKVYDFDEVNAIVVVEDLGDTIVRTELETCNESRKDEIVKNAIGLIATIQAATASAEESNSIAGRLRFDTEKLLWELNYFKIHYFTTYKKQPLETEADEAVGAEFQELSNELEGFASVLCHRDFHAANLMIDADGKLRIIDHQDARIGSPAYDLVSLLLDRVTELPPDEWIDDMKNFYLAERKRVNLPDLDSKQFDHEFDLQTVQRCLKAVGTFSFQSSAREKSYFIPYIEPMFRIVDRTLERLGQFPALRDVVGKQF